MGFFENLAKNLAGKLLCNQLGPIGQLIDGATTVQDLYSVFCEGVEQYKDRKKIREVYERVKSSRGLLLLFHRVQQQPGGKDLIKAVEATVGAAQVELDLKAEWENLYSQYGSDCFDGGSDQAIAFFTQSIRQNPHQSDAFEYRAIAYVQRGQLELAFSDYQSAMQLSPNQARHYSGCATIFMKAGDYPRALACYAEGATTGSTRLCSLLQSWHSSKESGALGQCACGLW